MVDKPTVLRCGFLFKKLFPAQVKDTHLTVKQVQAFRFSRKIFFKYFPRENLHNLCASYFFVKEKVSYVEGIETERKSSIIFFDRIILCNFVSVSRSLSLCRMG